MHSLTSMSVVVCVVRKPRPCNSYSRRRDRINSVLWRSYYKGGGGTSLLISQAHSLHGSQNHLEERLLDQAQAWASHTPPLLGVIRVAYPKA